MADTINVNIIDRSVPIKNPVNIAVVNVPNPAMNVTVDGDQLYNLINIPKYFITDSTTGTPITGANYEDYFPSGGGGGGGGGSITIDNFPTEGSRNAVSSGGTYSFVNSSVSTNTANFIGTFSSVADLEAYSGTVTNNDYAFVIGTDANGNTKYDRYKYTDSSDPASWEYEYTLNNSSFTAAEWATIQSGLTAADKTKYDGYETVINSKPGLIESSGGEIFNSYTGSSKNSAYYHAHAEGLGTSASGLASHAEGSNTIAMNPCSHAEGGGTTASGITAHAEGSNTTAIGNYSHAEGYSTTASGDNSHAEGYGTKASSNNQHVEGKFNIEDSSGKYAHIIGNGTADDARSNALAVDWDGKIYQPSDPNADPNGVYLSSKADKATTLSGYGITDAKFTPSTGIIQLGSNTLVPVTTIQINGTAQTNTNGTVNLPALTAGTAIGIANNTVSVKVGDGLTTDTSGNLKTTIVGEIMSETAYDQLATKTADVYFTYD